MPFAVWPPWLGSGAGAALFDAAVELDADDEESVWALACRRRKRRWHHP
ncbi:MAG: hypothetical protein WD271_08980 [Acidimicrobiia bacterium]